MSELPQDMHRETGRVLRLEGDLAVVSVSKSGACEGCAARGVCHSLGGSDERELRATNRVGAGPGDQVELALPTTRGLRAALWAYGLPTLVLVATAFAAHRAAGALALDPDLTAALAALGSLALLALGAYCHGRRRPRDPGSYPEIVRRL